MQLTYILFFLHKKIAFPIKKNKKNNNNIKLYIGVYMDSIMCSVVFHRIHKYNYFVYLYIYNLKFFPKKIGYLLTCMFYDVYYSNFSFFYVRYFYIKYFPEFSFFKLYTYLKKAVYVWQNFKLKKIHFYLYILYLYIIMRDKNHIIYICTFMCRYMYCSYNFDTYGIL